MPPEQDPFDFRFTPERDRQYRPARTDELAELESSLIAATSRPTQDAETSWRPMGMFSPDASPGQRGPNEQPAADSTQSIDAIGPNMGHFAIFFVLSAIFVIASQYGSLFALHSLHVFGRHSLAAYAEMMSGDARWLVPTEALGYLLVLCIAVPLFRWLWERPFSYGVHWNAAVARRHVPALLITGLGSGFGIGILGSVLPMPKNPPIMADMLHSPLGAWLMFAFGVTGAPLFEELFFRGFFLPAFLNAFRWLSRKGDLSPRAALWMGVPISFVLTSLPFALLHAPQVSHAWGPILLIGIVSLVLCGVRFRLNSLAASTLVHSAYNFTLFAGILFQTGGFRHLDRLAQ